MFSLNPVTAVFQAFIAVFTFKYGMKIFKFLFYLFVFTMFLYSAGPNQKELSKKSGWSQVGYKTVHLVRHNLRILTAKVIPIKSSYFDNVSSEEAKEYPDYRDAYIPLKGRQRAYLANGKNKYKALKRTMLSYYNALQSERKKLKREVASEVK